MSPRMDKMCTRPSQPTWTQSSRKHSDEITANRIDRWREKSSFQRNEIRRRWLHVTVVPQTMDCITHHLVALVMQSKMIDRPGRSRTWHFALRDPSRGPPGRHSGRLPPNTSFGFLADGCCVYACACVILRVEQCAWTISGRPNTQRATQGGNELVTRLSGWE